jgi:hypothetical protein
MTITINGSGSIAGLSVGGLPDGTVQQSDLAANVAGNGPAFSAYNSNQSFAATTYTKFTCNTESYDTNSNYDNTTNYRFQPTIAGYYWLYASMQSTSVNTSANVSIYKNGSIEQRLTATYPATVDTVSGSCLVYLNGSTDYAEGYGWWGAINSATTKFQGFLARSA